MNELETFLDSLFRQANGLVYLAFKTQDSWRQEFHEWPAQRTTIIEQILTQTPEREVYIGPALYSNPSATKNNVIGAFCFWVEFDGSVPTSFSGPEPTFRIKSSNNDHQHWYWSTNELNTPDILERLNRQLCYHLGADISGWDCTQVLRPPLTLNHKRDKVTVEILAASDASYREEDFADIPSVPETPSIVLPAKLPDLLSTVAKYKFKAKVWKLFQDGLPLGKRSEGLMALGYSLAEMGLSSGEILTFLLDADDRWGKFSKRTDQLSRLSSIVALARAKYPLVEQQTSRLQAYGLIGLLKVEQNLEWVWEGFLQRKGYLLLTGASGVGKTQLSLDFGAKAALGLEFLGKPISGPLRVGFLSLELGIEDLKFFAGNQAQGYTGEQLDQLEEYFKLFPVGEPIFLNRPDEREAIEDMITDNKLDGLIIDSLGSSTEGDLSDEGQIKVVMNWNDHLRNTHKCFTWWIHHNRKATSDNKKPAKLADVFGSMFIPRNATSVITLWDAGDSISVYMNKLRFSAKMPPFMIYRDGNLHFTTKKTGLNIVKKEVETDEEFKSIFKPGIKLS